MLRSEYSLNGFADYLKNLTDGVMRNAVKDVLKASAVILKNDLKLNMQKGVSPDGAAYKPLAFNRPNGKSSPLWDTGALARSTGAGAGHVEKMDATSLEIGSSLEYAALHQYGGTITPKKGKYLAIPLTMAAKRAGSPRNFPTPLKPRMGKKGGVLLGVSGKGKRAKETAQYALVKSVKVPARPFIGISDAAVKQIEDVALKAMEGRL